MNTYKITGADRATAAERTVVLEADDEKSAAAKAAKEHNLLVSKMRLLPPPKIMVPASTSDVGSLEYAVPPRRETLSEAAKRIVGAAANGAAEARADPANGGPHFHPTHARVPAYAVLGVVIWTLQIIGVLAIVASVLIFYAINATATARTSTSDGTRVLVIVSTAGPAFMSGLILFAFGELLSCVRDMAINSYRQLAK